MSRLYLGSLNVYHFHKLITNRDYKPFKMVFCTNQDVWYVVVDNIKMACEHQKLGIVFGT
jgi:hypothetical protein